MSFKIVSENRKAYHEYEILETFEAGIVLSGREIKAIRAGKMNLTGSYARILQNQKSKIKNQNDKSKVKNILSKSQKLTAKNHSNPELFLLGAHISVLNGDPHLRQGFGGQATRTRKLLMHRKEINRLIGKTQEKNLTLIPTKLYLKNGKAKVELGLGKGKKLHDKREIIKKRDLDRISRRSEL